MKTTFNLSPSYRHEQFLAHGSYRTTQITKEIPFPSLSAASRKIIIVLNPKLQDSFYIEIDAVYQKGAGDYANSQRVIWEASFEPETPEQWDILFQAFEHDRLERNEHNIPIIHEHLRELIQKMEQALNAVEPVYYRSDIFYRLMSQFEEYADAQLLLQQLQERYKGAEEEKQRLQKEKEAAATARRQAIEEEKKRWIHEQGSSMLRAKFEDGYNCQRDYVLERAGKEYPGYQVDFNDVASWDPRSCPGDAAFQEAQRVHGTVVYLTKAASSALPTEDDDDPNDYAYYPFEAGEAVVIRDYLGKYDLVRKMS